MLNLSDLTDPVSVDELGKAPDVPRGVLDIVAHLFGRFPGRRGRPQFPQVGGWVGWVVGWVGRVRWGLGGSCAAGNPCKHLGGFALQVLAGPPSSPRDRRLVPAACASWARGWHSFGGWLRVLSGGSRRHDVNRDSKAMSGGFRF